MDKVQHKALCQRGYTPNACTATPPPCQWASTLMCVLCCMHTSSHTPHVCPTWHKYFHSAILPAHWMLCKAMLLPSARLCGYIFSCTLATQSAATPAACHMATSARNLLCHTPLLLQTCSAAAKPSLLSCHACCTLLCSSHGLCCLLHRHGATALRTSSTMLHLCAPVPKVCWTRRCVPVPSQCRETLCATHIKTLGAKQRQSRTLVPCGPTTWYSAPNSTTPKYTGLFHWFQKGVQDTGHE